MAAETQITVETARGSFACTLRQFLTDNADAIDMLETAAIVATLDAGKPYTGGGGASPEWTIRRATTRAIITEPGL